MSAAYAIRNRIDGTKIEKIIFHSYVYTITGEIEQICDVKVHARGYRTRNFILMDEEFSPQPIKFSLIQNAVDMTSDFRTGDRVKITFKISGRRGRGRWSGHTFTNLEPLMIEKENTPS